MLIVHVTHMNYLELQVCVFCKLIDKQLLSTLV